MKVNLLSYSLYNEAGSSGECEGLILEHWATPIGRCTLKSRVVTVFGIATALSSLPYVIW